jgi:hypothetical protein
MSDTKVSGLVAAGLQSLAAIPNTYVPPFTGGAITSIAAKLAETVSVLDFGADPTGLTDSSGAFQAALNSGALYVKVPPPNPGKEYIVHDVTIPSGTTLDCTGAFFVDAPGSVFMFMLTGFRTRLIRPTVESAPNCSLGVIVVQNGFVCEVVGAQVINCINGFVTQATGTGNTPNTDHVQWVDCYCDTFTGVGFSVGPNCSETRAVNCYMDAGLVNGAGGLIPRASTTGFLINGTGSTFAFGGHEFTQCQASNTQDGWYLNNSNLVNFTQCAADDNSARGFAFDGTTNACVLTGCFSGTNFLGIWAGATTQGIFVNGPLIFGTGQIDGGDGSNWYTSATPGYNGYSMPSAAANVFVTGTASVSIDAAAWFADGGTAHVYNVASGAKLALPGSRKLEFGSPTPVAGNTTAFYGPGGQSTANGANNWITSENCVAQEFFVNFNTAPGSNNYTFTLVVNGAPTALTATATGSGIFTLSVVNGTQVGIPKGSAIQFSVNNPSGGSSTFFSGYIQLIPQP